ncbi:MAG: type II toxin-antitoxin system RelE/ParE family toxin [Candidatus Uhrbacteria bacterium]|nr:type II toxin-antitoxin system RelE/ParE family toxin [Candidatus Uhrbacteria bacterium]
MEYYFKAHALKLLKKLPKDVQIRMIKKLDFFCSQDDPIDFAESLVRSELGSYRFRIGDYRVIFDLEDDGIIILLVGHRRDIYR